MRDAPLAATPTLIHEGVRWLGRTDYLATWRAMQSFTSARIADTPDEIWLTEHGPIYTLGLAGRTEHLHDDHGIPVQKVDRGGQVTYHGPGQLVAYLLIDLRRRRLGVRRLVRAVERGVVEWLARYDIEAYGRDDAPGVYVRRKSEPGQSEAKIAALGFRVRNGCTYHGVSVNIAMDLAPFLDIDPCGHRGLAVTHVAAFAPPPTVHAAGVALAPLLWQSIEGAAS